MGGAVGVQECASRPSLMARLDVIKERLNKHHALLSQVHTNVNGGQPPKSLEANKPTQVTVDSIVEDIERAVGNCEDQFHGIASFIGI